MKKKLKKFDKELEADLAQSFKEFKKGRAHGPFKTVNELFNFLDRKRKWNSQVKI